MNETHKQHEQHLEVALRNECTKKMSCMQSNVRTVVLEVRKQCKDVLHHIQKKKIHWYVAVVGGMRISLEKIGGLRHGIFI